MESSRPHNRRKARREYRASKFRRMVRRLASYGCEDGRCGKESGNQIAGVVRADEEGRGGGGA